MASIPAYRNILKRSLPLITKVICEELLRILNEEKNRRKMKQVSDRMNTKLLRILNEEKNRRKRKQVPDRVNTKRSRPSETIARELYSTDTGEFKSVMRLLPEQFDELLALVSPIIACEDTVMREALPARLKLEVTLNFLQSGGNYGTLQKNLPVSKAAISSFLPGVCEAISTVLSDFIKVPDQEEWEQIQVAFHNELNFPGCCGAIGGKHIAVKPLNHINGLDNNKETTSVVLLAIVDHNYCFKYVNIESYDRYNDEGAFQQSDMYKLLENNFLPKGRVLVGDIAFPLKEYLLTPYLKPNLKRETKIYNYRINRAQRIVENTFGILVSRFRVLAKPIGIKVSTTKLAVKAACSLHNWLRCKSPNYYTPPGSFDYEDIENTTVVLGQWRKEIKELPNIEKIKIYRGTRPAVQLRDTYKDKFSGDWAVEWQDKMIC